ncbi:nitrile hydratase subunit beta [Geodermatophilus ruber]|uniref:Nitrile hydratase subunit beta n=1 Tax=Geodermatophilus ruber TaxID=504800 RepID=A0A1I4BLH5_9ACTN|nr:nitrile hydratase subunit beta [Geodermatophilus ruber]SFK69575.1 nitrile hydratase [Geodermatophilus ruber]
MDGVHDMGGKAEHFGPLPTIDPQEPVFHAEWEGKAFALALLANRVSGANLHAFRHAIERVPEPEYLSGYYERWLASAEILLVDSGILAPGAVAARAENLRGGRVEEPAVPEPHKPTMPSGGGGNLRTVEESPAFAVGDAVTTRTSVPSTHDRLPSYARGRTGTVTAVQPAQVLPDTAAHFVGENPQHVYAVEFAAHELWGEDAEPFTLTLDLYESYLEKA